MFVCFIFNTEGRTGLEEIAFLRDLAEKDNGTSFQYNDIPDLPHRQVRDILRVG